LLSTESCEQTLPFICEVNMQIINSINFYLPFVNQARLGDDPDKDAAKECDAVLQLKKSIHAEGIN